MHLFGVVQAHRTSSNLLEPHHNRDSKVCRVLSHEFGVVRLHRTFSIHIVTGETRCAGCLCTSSGWFKHPCKDVVREGSVTQSNHPKLMWKNSTHLAISVMMWFEKVRGGSMRLNHPELVYEHPAHLVSPVMSPPVSHITFFRGDFVVAVGNCKFANRNFTPLRPSVARCLCTSSGWFTCIEPPRTFSNHIIAEIARCVEFFHMSSVWFDCTKPSLTTSLQGTQGVQGAYALVRGGIEHPRTISNHIIAEIARRVEFFHMNSG